MAVSAEGFVAIRYLLQPQFKVQFMEPRLYCPKIEKKCLNNLQPIEQTLYAGLLLIEVQLIFHCFYSSFFGCKDLYIFKYEQNLNARCHLR